MSIATRPIAVDSYVFDVLRRDLVGHDHSPSVNASESGRSVNPPLILPIVITWSMIRCSPAMMCWSIVGHARRHTAGPMAPSMIERSYFEVGRDAVVIRSCRRVYYAPFADGLCPSPGQRVARGPEGWDETDGSS